MVCRNATATSAWRPCASAAAKAWRWSLSASPDRAGAGSAHFPHPAYTLRQLECFLAVAESGTIAGAAATLHSSESAVADAVSGLERALRSTLFQRQRARGVTLTSDGLAVLPAARRLLRDAEDVTSVVG